MSCHRTPHPHMKKSHFTENEFSFFFPTRSGIIFRGSVIIFLYIKKLQYLLAYTVICGQLTKHSVFFPAALQERCLPTFQTKSKYMFMFFEKKKWKNYAHTHRVKNHFLGDERPDAGNSSSHMDSDVPHIARTPMLLQA